MPSKNHPIDFYVHKVHRFLFIKHQTLSFITAFGIYVILFLSFARDLHLASNLIVLIPIFAAALGFGLWGGFLAGALGLLVNIALLFFLQDYSAIPSNLIIIEVAWILIGTIMGYLSDFFKRLESEDTEKTQAERSLRMALEEKDLLLREIHHRVKNNLNLLKSLVQLQMNRSTNPHFLECSRSFKQRIYSIALVFDQLYQGNTFETLELRRYLPDLMEHFFEVYHDFSVKWSVNVTYPNLSLDVESVTTVGLVVSETLTNIIKHGCQNISAPQVDLELSLVNDDIHLEMYDNTAPWNPQEAASGLGMKIISSLAKQLRGEATWQSLPQRNLFTLTWPLHQTPVTEEAQELF